MGVAQMLSNTLSRSCCFAARSARPLLLGYHGELAIWMMFQLSMKYWEGFPVNWVLLCVTILFGLQNRPQWLLAQLQWSLDSGCNIYEEQILLTSNIKHVTGYVLPGSRWCLLGCERYMAVIGLMLLASVAGFTELFNVFVNVWLVYFLLASCVVFSTSWWPSWSSGRYPVVLYGFSYHDSFIFTHDSSLDHKFIFQRPLWPEVCRELVHGVGQHNINDKHQFSQHWILLCFFD